MSSSSNSPSTRRRARRQPVRWSASTHRNGASPRHRPRILIFDEATSALDYESERIIQNNMQQICQRRTVFVIAHRLSTVRRADRIITIERGRIVEDGTHDELMRTKGSYANLHYLQAGIQ